MEKVCKNCYWFKPDSCYSDKITCLDNFKKVKEKDTCANFCKEKDYEPTGIWVGVAELVEAIAKEVERRESEAL